jgi:hypothetical protein
MVTSVLLHTWKQVCFQYMVVHVDSLYVFRKNDKNEVHFKLPYTVCSLAEVSFGSDS